MFIFMGQLYCTLFQKLSSWIHSRLPLISYLGVSGNKSAANKAYISAQTIAINLLQMEFSSRFMAHVRREPKTQEKARSRVMSHL